MILILITAMTYAAIAAFAVAVMTGRITLKHSARNGDDE